MDITPIRIFPLKMTLFYFSVFFDYTMANLPPRLEEQRADLLHYVDRED